MKVKFDNYVTYLSPKDYKQREGIAKRLLTMIGMPNRSFGDIKIVYRHLQNGDMLLLNRMQTVRHIMLILMEMKLMHTFLRMK